MISVAHDLYRSAKRRGDRPNLDPSDAKIAMPPRLPVVLRARRVASLPPRSSR